MHLWLVQVISAIAILDPEIVAVLPIQLKEKVLGTVKITWTPKLCNVDTGVVGRTGVLWHQ